MGKFSVLPFLFLFSLGIVGIYSQNPYENLFSTTKPPDGTTRTTPSPTTTTTRSTTPFTTRSRFTRTTRGTDTTRMTTNPTSGTTKPPRSSEEDGNSDEIDQSEEKKVYKLKRNEKFVPPSCGKKVTNCDPKTTFRTLDGSCNNLINPEWGLPNATYHRLLPAQYGNGKRSPRRGHNKKQPLPNARKVRTEIFPTGEVNNTLWNINAMQWGQFMAHDMSLLKEPETEFECCTADKKYKRRPSRFCYPIKVPVKDLTMGKAGIRCMNFTRTMTDKDLGCGKAGESPQQINAVTSWLDLSNVYGLDKEMSDGLRSFKGGELKTEVRNGVIFAPRETNLQDNCRCNRGSENVCYKTGDSRSNQNPQLAILQTIFVREHNRIARELAKLNPQWNDERLFQEARRILIAAYQRITYYEWLPIFLGTKNLLDNKIIFKEPGFINDYNSSITPAISNEHAHAAYRFFHTHIVGMIKMLDANRQTKSAFSLTEWFNRPQVIENSKSMIEDLTIGMVTQNIEETDNIFVKEITDELFACGNKFGIDLRAADIQRDRDHAISYYSDYRKFFGGKEINSFDDFNDVILPEKISILKNLYKDARDVDLTVGGGIEILASGAQVGTTFLSILNDQFLRSRQADRFWFENDSSGLTLDQLNEIRKATVSRMFCDNGDGIKSMQRIGFTLIFPNFNKLEPCANIPSIDLSKWKA